MVQEGQFTVNEHIFLDKLKGIQMYHTEDHNGRKAVTEMIDSNYVRTLFLNIFKL